jgi:hypothetical protein
VGLERDPLSLVNNLRRYLEEIVAAPGLENRSYGRRDSLRWPRHTLYTFWDTLYNVTFYYTRVLYNNYFGSHQSNLFYQFLLFYRALNFIKITLCLF